MMPSDYSHQMTSQMANFQHQAENSPIYQSAPMTSPIYAFPQQTYPTPPPSQQMQQVSPQYANQQIQDPIASYAYHQMQMTHPTWPYPTGWETGAFGMFVTPVPSPFPTQMVHPAHQQSIHQSGMFRTSGKPARSRIPFTEVQLDALKARYAKHTNIQVDERREMSKRIGLTPEQIKIWFQNRRFKERKAQAMKEQFRKEAEDAIVNKLEQPDQ